LANHLQAIGISQSSTWPILGQSPFLVPKSAKFDWSEKFNQSKRSKNVDFVNFSENFGILADFVNFDTPVRGVDQSEFPKRRICHCCVYNIIIKNQ
jgi:hypothetical protein